MTSIYDLLHSDAAKHFDKLLVSKLIQDLDTNSFYLGGQIHMIKNDIITMDLIQKSKNITKQRLIDYGGPCNSWEMYSMQRSDKELTLIEDLLTHK